MYFCRTKLPNTLSSTETRSILIIYFGLCGINYSGDVETNALGKKMYIFESAENFIYSELKNEIHKMYEHDSCVFE